MITLRPYQVEAVEQGLKRLRSLGIAYLCMEVRTGKTLSALEIARQYGAKKVLFLTKKKAIGSVRSDFELLNPGYELTVINDESLHQVEGDFDLLIRDEHHRSGAFPKPGMVTKTLKERFSKLPMIFLSGTPTPEGWSQIYHQFWISDRSPFVEASFYQWAKNFVKIRQKMVRERMVNDYTDAHIDRIAPIVDPYMVRITQAQAGFESKIIEEFIYVEQGLPLRTTIAILQRDLVVQGKVHSITAATSVSLMQKLHQLGGGTIKFDEIPEQPRASKTLDYSKVEVIANRFAGQKIVIFYQYVQELAALQERLGDALTTDLDEFNSTDKSIVLQIVSGREGINLSKASAIVFYNLSFSATSYWQARDRMTTIDRAESRVYWLFSKNGIEEKIYAAVSKKKDYTVRAFKKDFGVQNTGIDRPVPEKRRLASH